MFITGLDFLYNVDIFVLFRLFYYSSIVMCFPLQDDVPAEQGGSDGLDSSGSGDEDSEEDSDEDSDDDSDECTEDGDGDEDKESEEDEPLSLEWPDTLSKQATYLFLLPIVLPLSFTVPDVRNQVRGDRNI